jgi:hypothetical protein
LIILLKGKEKHHKERVKTICSSTLKHYTRLLVQRRSDYGSFHFSNSCIVSEIQQTYLRSCDHSSGCSKRRCQGRCGMDQAIHIFGEQSQRIIEFVSSVFRSEFQSDYTGEDGISNTGARRSFTLRTACSQCSGPVLAGSFPTYDSPTDHTPQAHGWKEMPLRWCWSQHA